MKAIFLLSLFLLPPIVIRGETPTEKRVEKIEGKVEEKSPSTSSLNDPEKKLLGIHLTRGPKGNRITAVVQGSPADKAGVRPGDLVTSLDGKDVTSLSPQDLLRELEKKDTFAFTLEPKAGEQKEVKISKARQGDLLNERDGFTLLDGGVSLSEVEIGQAAPEIAAKDSAGNEVKLSSLKGKVVLVNFTATWCAPCQLEFPTLLKLYKEYHHKGFEIVSVFLDRDQSAVDRHLKENRIPWAFAFDGKGWDTDVAREWGISGVPTNPVVNRNGIVAEDNARGASIQKAIEKYLN